MVHLNYQHLYYFWTVAHEGGIQQAAHKLRLAHPTISGQIKQLELTLGHQLLRRKGRRLELTEMGKLALGYADVIFSTGSELLAALEGAEAAVTKRVVVGVTPVMPKHVVKKLLEPAFALRPIVRVVVEEDRLERLLAELSIHNLDVVLADRQAPPEVDVKAFHHSLGDCAVTFLAAPRFAKALRRGFPGSLAGAPMILPTKGSNLRRSLDNWFQQEGLTVNVVAEVADSALAKVFAASELGILIVPEVIEKEVCQQFSVVRVGTLPEIRTQFVAISTERRVTNPAVRAICDSARADLFNA